jgi:hypothetical protein
VAGGNLHQSDLVATRQTVPGKFAAGFNRTNKDGAMLVDLFIGLESQSKPRHCFSSSILGPARNFHLGGRRGLLPAAKRSNDDTKNQESHSHIRYLSEKTIKPEQSRT